MTSVTEPGELPGRVDETIGALLGAPPLSLSLTKQGMWLAGPKGLHSQPVCITLAVRPFGINNVL